MIYLGLLASFEVALAQRILSLSEGTIGEISALLSRAALARLRTNHERLSGWCGYTSPRERRRQPAMVTS
jgi:transposase InsO family protein